MDELLKALEVPKDTPAAGVLEKFFKGADSNGDSLISWDECQAFFKNAQ